jgi:hypothetical protein
MSSDEIIQYLNSNKFSKADIIALLEGIGINVKPLSLVKLSNFAAIQISNYGVFERIANRTR